MLTLIEVDVPVNMFYKGKNNHAERPNFYTDNLVGQLLLHRTEGPSLSSKMTKDIS